MTSSLLTVLTPASSRALTTLATVKDEIGITDDAADARLQRWIDEASERIETYLGRVLTAETVRETFRLTGAPGCLGLARRPVTAIVSIDVDSVTLASDQYEVGAEQKTALAKHAAFLKANRAVRVVLRGHTDGTASEEYNLALGQKRAESVRQALIALGVGSDRMETVSFGEALPIKEGDDPPARAGNRRVEFFLYAVE